MLVSIKSHIARPARGGFLLMVLATVLGCGRSTSAPAVLRVGKTRIDAATVRHWEGAIGLGAGITSHDALPGESRRTQAVHFLISGTRVIEEATSRGLAISSSAVRRRVEDTFGDLSNTSKIDRALASTGRTIADAEFEARVTLGLLGAARSDTQPHSGSDRSGDREVLPATPPGPLPPGTSRRRSDRAAEESEGCDCPGESPWAGKAVHETRCTRDRGTTHAPGGRTGSQRTSRPRHLRRADPQDFRPRGVRRKVGHLRRTESRSRTSGVSGSDGGNRRTPHSSPSTGGPQRLSREISTRMEDQDVLPNRVRRPRVLRER